MATAARQPKNRKAEPQGSVRRPNAWTNNNRSSGTFSPGPNRQNGVSSPAPGAGPTRDNSAATSNNTPGAPFSPPAGGANTNGTANNSAATGPRSDADRTLQSLAGLTGTTVTVTLRNGPRFEGVVSSTGMEGDTNGLTLKDARDVNVPGAPIKDRQFIAASNIASWLSGPADAKPTAPNGDTFKTDVDISFKAAPRRERELQAWADDSAGLDLSPGGANNSPGATIGHGDDLTFGNGANRSGNWDQFATNEKLFGVKTGFDENLYTTKLDRDAPNYKEKERRAQQIANEIMGGTTNNSHIAEERVMNTVDDSGMNEEDKYGAVVRGANAYVPPAARKGSTGNVVPKLSVNGPDGSPAPAPTIVTSGPSSASATPAPSGGKAAAPEAAFREFVSNEKQRLALKKQSMMRKDMENKFADLLAFSKGFKLKQPIPDDLVPILAKDEEKQKAIRDKAIADASTPVARGISTAAAGTITPSPSAAQPLATNPVRLDAAHAKAGGIPASASAKAAGGKAPERKEKVKPAMFIQAIPSFRGKKNSTDTSPAANAAAAATANDSKLLNQNAPSFRPNPKASVFSPVPPVAPVTKSQPPAAAAPKTAKPTEASTSTSSGSPAQTQAPSAPNPFFGPKPLKKGPPVSIRDDFNPFKHHKVADPSAIGSSWPYSGKRFMQMFPPVSGPPAGAVQVGLQMQMQGQMQGQMQMQQGQGQGQMQGPGQGQMQGGQGQGQMQMPGQNGHPPGGVPVGVQGVGPGQPQQGPGPQASPHMAPPQIIPQPVPVPGQPGGYEEDPAAAAARAAAAGQYMYFPPYPYGGQPMMPGMPPPGPPGPYMAGPYMQPMYAPPMQGPNGQPMYAASPSMGQMQLAPGGYMPPPPGYPQQNGPGQRSMPPTPMPAHAHPHPYYQPSPQMQHAVPYQLMMQPQQHPGGPGPGPNGPNGLNGPPPPQHFEGPPQPVPMGGGPGHA